jgi:hypothetical protein
MTKSKMKTILLSLLLCFSTLYSKNIPYEKEIKKVVFNYANSIGCTQGNPDTMEDMEDVFLQNGIFTLKPAKEGSYDGDYVVIFIGDIVCKGGNQMLSFNIARVIQGGTFGNSFYVDPKRSSPNISPEFSGEHINKIISFKNNILTLEVATYKKNDPMCCPSKLHKARYKFDKSGGFRFMK